MRGFWGGFACGLLWGVMIGALFALAEFAAAGAR
jgi:hypothetical protein